MPTKTDVINLINTLILDNSSREISAADVRSVLFDVLDYVEELDIGENPTDLDAIYMKIENAYTKGQVDNLLSAIQSNAPYIGGNGNWYVDGEDTGVSATGPAGAPGATGPAGPTGEQGPSGGTGPAGPTPTIGSNGNWVIDGNDTGVRASTWEKTDYNENISGSRTGGNSQFFASEHYVPGTMKVWMDGLRLSRGFAGDFTENGDHISVTIQRPGITMETLFIFEYQRANIGS